MNNKIFLNYILLSVLLLISSLSWAERSMNLYVGQVRPVIVGKVARVAVGKDSILKTIVLDDGKILFIPTGPGETDVKIWLKNDKVVSYKFKILAANMGSRKVIAQSLLRAFPGLRVTSVDKHIIVEGKISPVDQIVYKSVIGKIENVVSLVNPNKFNEYQIRQLMIAFGVEAVQIKRAGKRFVITGEIDPEDKKTLDTVIGKIPNISSLIRSKSFVSKRMVRLKVRVAQIDSNYSRQLGIRWQGDAAGPIFTAATPIIGNDRFGVVPQSVDVNGVDFVGLLSGAPNKAALDFRFATNIISRLNFLESNGKAKTLSRPELLARSGAEASFRVGGQIPYIVLDGFGNPITAFKNYGVEVVMTPVVNRKNEIKLKISTEVSSPANTSSNPPINMVVASTEVNAYSGQTIAIAGLLDVKDGLNNDKVPFLGNIPVLGNLFKNKNKATSLKEVVFLITPELVITNRLNNTPVHLRDDIKSLEVLQVPLDRDVQGSSFVTDILE